MGKKEAKNIIACALEHERGREREMQKERESRGL